jgi:peptide deformylase
MRPAGSPPSWSTDSPCAEVPERAIRLFGDPVLKTPSAPIENVDERVRSLVQDLVDSVEVPGRAGVAASQIGVNLRAFSYNVDGKVGYLLNPRIVEVRGEPELIDEGCLSVPELWYPVLRHPWARAEGVDLDGQRVVVEGGGVLAQALQHEVDHLDGMLYLDRLDKERRREAMRRIRESAWF